MNESFLPLSHAALSGSATGGSGFRVTVVKEGGDLQSFQPLGRAGKAHSGGQCEPSVTLQRDGDRVSAIRIQCSCGQVVELACVYPGAPAGAKV
jgi:hypothetical protein